EVATKRAALRGGRVMAAASYSTPLLRALGIALPVRPAKGDRRDASREPESSSPDRDLKILIVDDDMHAAVVPVDLSIRIAATAEFFRLRSDRTIRAPAHSLPRGAVYPALRGTRPRNRKAVVWPAPHVG